MDGWMDGGWEGGMTVSRRDIVVSITNPTVQNLSFSLFLPSSPSLSRHRLQSHARNPLGLCRLREAPLRSLFRPNALLHDELNRLHRGDNPTSRLQIQSRRRREGKRDQYSCEQLIRTTMDLLIEHAKVG